MTHKSIHMIVVVSFRGLKGPRYHFSCLKLPKIREAANIKRFSKLFIALNNIRIG